MRSAFIQFHLRFWLHVMFFPHSGPGHGPITTWYFSKTVRYILLTILVPPHQFIQRKTNSWSRWFGFIMVLVLIWFFCFKQKKAVARPRHQEPFQVGIGSKFLKTVDLIRDVHFNSAYHFWTFAYFSRGREQTALCILQFINCTYLQGPPTWT